MRGETDPFRMRASGAVQGYRARFLLAKSFSVYFPRFAYETQRGSLGVQTRPNDGHDRARAHMLLYLCLYARIHANSNGNAPEYTCIVPGYATI